MPQLSFNLSSQALNELVDCECYFGNYQPIVDGLPNPESKAQFAKRNQIEYLKNRVREYRKQQAEIVARAAVSVVEPDIT